MAPVTDGDQVMSALPSETTRDLSSKKAVKHDPPTLFPDHWEINKLLYYVSPHGVCLILIPKSIGQPMKPIKPEPFPFLSLFSRVSFIVLFVCLFVWFGFWDRSLPGWPQTNDVPWPSNPPAFNFWELRLQVCTNTSSLWGAEVEFKASCTRAKHLPNNPHSSAVPVIWFPNFCLTASGESDYGFGPRR